MNLPDLRVDVYFFLIHALSASGGPGRIRFAQSGMVYAMDMSRNEFFAWCDARGLTKSQDISESFRVSSQTIRNWLRKEADEPMPAWVSLACLALSPVLAGENSAISSQMTVAKLSSWQRKHSFKTYEDTANVFSIKRQAVHNWHKRGRFPKWLSLACVGYDLSVLSNSAKDSNVAA